MGVKRKDYRMNKYKIESLDVTFIIYKMKKNIKGINIRILSYYYIIYQTSLWDKLSTTM